MILKNHMKQVDESKGFTLLELMVGLVIFMIGITGLMGMIIMQAQGNRISKGLDEASTVVQAQVETMAAVTYSDLGTDASAPSTNGLSNASILAQGPLNRLGQSIGTGTGPYSYYRYSVICDSTTSSVAPSSTPDYCGLLGSARPPELACSTISPALTNREKMIRVLVAWTDRNGKCHYKTSDSLQFN